MEIPIGIIMKYAENDHLNVDNGKIAFVNNFDGLH